MQASITTLFLVVSWQLHVTEPTFFLQVSIFRCFYEDFLAVKPQTVLASEASTLGGVAKDDYVHVVGGDVQGEGVRILQWGRAWEAVVQYRRWRQGASLLKKSFTGGRRSAGVSELPLIVTFCIFFFYWVWLHLQKPDKEKKNFFPSYLHVAGTFSSSQRRFFWEKTSKRSGTRKTDSDPPSLLQSWCRWTASSLSVCTPSCTNPNTLLCTPAPRPSAEPAFPHRRWVQNSLVTSCSSYKTSSPLWQCRKRL